MEDGWGPMGGSGSWGCVFGRHILLRFVLLHHIPRTKNCGLKISATVSQSKSSSLKLFMSCILVFCHSVERPIDE